MLQPLRLASALRAAFIVFAALAVVGAARAEMTLRLQDYAAAPITGTFSAGGNSAYAARINFMADDPANSNRFFLNDLNGPLYVVDKGTKAFTPYLNLNGQSGQPGMFERFVNASGFANGFITFQFDPDFANNGKFYTVHMESNSSSNLTPINTTTWGLNATGYTTTTSIDAPGDDNPDRRTVLIEWTDTNVNNSTFEGTARELMRVDMFSSIHPMGDLAFNPAAGPGDPDWRVMYISLGDGGSGEATGASNAAERRTPQQFNAPGGKILRILPDVAMNPGSSTLSSNGRYRIPNDNPFVATNTDATFGDEVYAMGFRNPHRMSWDMDPANPANSRLIVDDIGLHTWEEVNVVQAGGNYGYSQREGNQALSTGNGIGPLPETDLVTTRLNDSTVGPSATPLYPVIQYGHGLEGQPMPAGDSVSSGYVYRGSNIPSLYGKYVFGDISTGQLFWADFAEMLAVDDGNPSTLAQIHSFDVLWDNPNSPGGEQLYTTTIIPDPTPNNSLVDAFGPMFPIVEAAYEARGGTLSGLPGGADVTGSSGRADIRIQVDAAGELYIISKSDGMIRYIVEAVGNADFNDDNQVDGQDFLIWQRNLGSAGGLAEGDADGDGRVTSADLGYIKQQFGQQFESEPPVAAVPEPAAAWLALIGLAAFRRR
jgi:hypothetical protein